MRVLKKISLLLAGLMLLLHTMLPHEHHTELNEAAHIVEHQTATGLLDFIKLAFHLDQGEGHLEKFKTAGFNYFFEAIPYTEIELEQFVPVFIDNDFQVLASIDTFSSRYLSSQLRFRGPPLQA